MARRVIEMRGFGGANYYDQQELLTIAAETGKIVESPDLLNVDFAQYGVKKREGSYLDSNLTLQSGEVVVAATVFESVDGTVSEIVVGSKSIYRRLAGGSAWAQLTKHDGTTLYTHAADVSKSTFAKLDGHLFIGLDGVNQIQVYRDGGNLEYELKEETLASTTTTGTNSAGASQLRVTSTAGMNADDWLVVDEGGTPYYYSVVSVDTAALMTVTPVLQASHSPGLTVDAKTHYHEAYDPSIAYTIKGTWSTGAYMVAAVNNRLVYSTGKNFLEFTPIADTPSSGIWDLDTPTFSGFHAFGSRIRMMESFAPFLADTLSERLYVGTDAGMEILSGFTASDTLVRLDGARAPLSYRAHTKTLGWLMYITADRSIFGVNGLQVVDFGRKLRSPDQDGPLDVMATSTTLASLAFAYYNRLRRQAYFFFCSRGQTSPNTCAVVDLFLGESPDAARTLVWRCDAGKWFDHVYSNDTDRKFFGVRAEAGDTAGVYTVGQGLNDLDGPSLTPTAVRGRWQTPILHGGSYIATKRWTRFSVKQRAFIAAQIIDCGALPLVEVLQTLDCGSLPGSSVTRSIDAGSLSVTGGDVLVQLFLEERDSPALEEAFPEVTEAGTGAYVRTIDFFSYGTTLYGVVENKEIDSTFNFAGVKVEFVIGRDIVN